MSLLKILEVNRSRQRGIVYRSGAELISRLSEFKLVAPHFDEQTEGGVRSTLLLLRILGCVALCPKRLSILPILA